MSMFVDYNDRPIQTPPNFGFLMKMHLKPNNLTLCTCHDLVSVHPIFPDNMEFHIDVSQPQVILGRNSFMPDIYPMTSDYHFVDSMEHNDSIQIEIPKQVTFLTGSLDHIIRL